MVWHLLLPCASPDLHRAGFDAGFLFPVDTDRFP